MRQRIEDDDDDGGGDMSNDYHEAHFDEGRREVEPKATQRRIMTCCLWHINHFTGIPMFLNSMLLHAYWP